MQTDVDYLLGPAGPFAEHFDGYQPREGQIKYARAVQGTLQSGDAPLFIEGPTGTGKSIGYLLPAIGHALTQGDIAVEVWDEDAGKMVSKVRKRHIIVVTGNIALQEQLVQKDLPTIKEVTGWDFNYALLKGRSNFLCNRNAEALRSGDESNDFSEDVARILEWARQTTLGDKSEITPSPDGLAWTAFTAGPDDCDGAKCPFYKECHYYNQRRASMEADVIVTNYHLLFTEVMIRASLGQPVLLPEFDILICDEGHEAEGIARDFFAKEVSASGLQNLGRLLNGPIIGLKDLADEVWDLARTWENRADNYVQTNRGSLLYRPEDFTDLGDRANDLMIRVAKEVEAVADNEKTAHGFDGCSIMELPNEMRKRISAILKPATIARSYGEKVSEIFPSEPDHKGTVYYINQQKRQTRDGQWKVVSSFKVCPFDIGSVLREQVWEQSSSLVVTSATLATDGDFSYARKNLGLQGGADGHKCYELVVETPFDYQKNMGVYIADDIMPSVSSLQKIADRVEVLLRASNGRALCLFTSYAAMNGVYEILLHANLPYTLMRQGDESNKRLTDMFREDTHSCLFATRSFFQGIDIAGESLSMVILDKIPFPMMSDPFMEKHKVLNPRTWFNDAYVPEALQDFRQAVGRLLRRTTDRGVVAILDGRMGQGSSRKNYGGRFRRAIGSSTTLTLNGVADWFGREPTRCPQEVRDEQYANDDDIPF